jgi:hypothetical protein
MKANGVAAPIHCSASMHSSNPVSEPASIRPPQARRNRAVGATVSVAEPADVAVERATAASGGGRHDVLRFAAGAASIRCHRSVRLLGRHGCSPGSCGSCRGRTDLPGRRRRSRRRAQHPCWAIGRPFDRRRDPADGARSAAAGTLPCMVPDPLRRCDRLGEQPLSRRGARRGAVRSPLAAGAGRGLRRFASGRRCPPTGA